MKWSSYIVGFSIAGDVYDIKKIIGVGVRVAEQKILEIGVGKRKFFGVKNVDCRALMSYYI